MPFFGYKKYIGKRLREYTIVKPIGRGRYGVCFLAKSDGGVEVVIKKFKPGIFKKNKDKNMYEAVILSKLGDDRIPELLGVINEKNFYCFILEYKQGQTLKDMLFKDKRRLTEEEIYSIGGQLLDIIAYLHGNGVVHRDVRLPNVLYDGGRIYLIDFGLARWADNGKYQLNLDFSYLGELLLYLIYSSYERKAKQKKQPWYKELPLSNERKRVLKKLFGLEPVYKNIGEIKDDFSTVFKPDYWRLK